MARYCGHCGTELLEIDSFCRFCGTLQPLDPPTHTTNAYVGGHRATKYFVAWLAIVIITSIVLSIYLGFIG